MELKDQLSALQGELKTYVAKATEEKSQYGTMLTETKTALENLQKQVDAVDLKLATKSVGEPSKTLVDELKENDSVARIMRDRKGHATFTLKSANPLERKTVITSAAVGSSVSGVLGIERIPGIVSEARQTLRLRDLLVSRPTQMALIDFVRVLSPLGNAAMVPEGTTKPELAVTFAAKSERIKTIAAVLPASKQILADFTELAGYLQDAMPFALESEEELQMLSGDSVGENLDGFITQAQAYNTSLTATGDNRIDIIGHAFSQVAVAKELAPTFVVINEADWWSIRLQKDGYGRYILGDPQANVSPSLFGVPVVATTNMAPNTFLVGSGAAPAAEIRDREETIVEISTEDGNNFRNNLVTLRCEKRMALIVKRPNAYVSGSFTTSH